MKRIATLMAFGALTLAFGCDNRGGDTDGGIHLMDDDGGTGGHDAGMMTMQDSGSGTADAGTDMCPPGEAPAAEMPMACAHDTLTCLMGATTPETQQACIDADPNAEACNGCLNQDVFHNCTAGGGPCADQWGEAQCCISEQCASTPTAECAENAVGTMAAPGPCATQFNTFLQCVNSSQGVGNCGVAATCFSAT